MPAIVPKVEFDTIAREWRCKWSADSDKKSLEDVEVILDKLLPQIEARTGVKKVQRIVCGGCLDFKVITSVSADSFGDWEKEGFVPESSFLAAIKGVPGVTKVETQTYTLMPAGCSSDPAGSTALTKSVSFDTIAREWRCKWSVDNDKKSLTAAQEVLDELLPQIKAMPAVKDVQRIVCGGCHDFKVITALPAAHFGDWEKAEFAPENKFLAKLKEIPGISAVETQTYTLMPAKAKKAAAVDPKSLCVGIVIGAVAMTCLSALKK
jgi:hypothetical protein